MFGILIADSEPAKGLMPFLKENWLVLLPAVLGFAAIYLLLPRVRRFNLIWGSALAVIGLVLGAAVLVRTDAVWIEALLFYSFSGLAVVAGVMMITQKNPVHAALSFALVVLSTCGLFLLQAAPFLMAATIIIYAGAIVVTFLFVIMLAQQEGISNADQQSREPFLSCLAGCILLGSLLCVLQRSYAENPNDADLRDLQRLSEAKDESEIKSVLGDPKTAKPGELTRQMLERLRQQYPDPAVHAESQHLQTAWIVMNVAKVQERAKTLQDAVKSHLQRQGSLALNKVPGKPENGTPSHFKPGTLPAANVASLGRTLFTDYLIAVELAGVLLLVATIGAIAIAGRRSEELR
jgi:NADH-quinone oxidoreductase subunit J